MSATIVDELRVDVRRARFYAEGWQSWSPTTWARWGSPHRPQEPWQHVMRFRPGTPLAAGDAIQGEGLLLVDPGIGGPTRLYAVQDAREHVTTIQAALSGDRLTVTADGPVTATSHDDPVVGLA